MRHSLYGTHFSLHLSLALSLSFTTSRLSASRGIEVHTNHGPQELLFRATQISDHFVKFGEFSEFVGQFQQNGPEVTVVCFSELADFAEFAVKLAQIQKIQPMRHHQILPTL